MRVLLVTLGVAVISLAKPSSVSAQSPVDTPREPGVSIRMYDIGKSMSKLHALVAGQTPNVSKVIPQLDLHGARGDFAPMSEYFILVADGYIDAPEPGRYEFELSSDDGSVLQINGHTIVDNDGAHATSAATGPVVLPAGLHPFELRFFQSAGEKDLWLKWKRPGKATFELIPTTALSCRKGEVRVTSPGRKKIIEPLPRGRPGDGQPLAGVHPSYVLSRARPTWFQPRVGGIDWLPDGRMIICTWDADGSVYILDGADGDDPESIVVKRLAAGLAEPLGISVVDGEIFVLQKQELTQLVDRDGDDVADEYHCVSSGWNVSANFHEFAFGLVHKTGYFYGNLAIAINPGGASTWPQVPERGSAIRISPDGDYEIVAHGLRTPNGIGLGVDDEIFITDNQGDWVPVSKVVHLKDGAFYGSRAVIGKQDESNPVTPPVVWLPQGEIGNSPGNVIPMHDRPYVGQMLHTDITHGGLKRVFVEKVYGDYQGCVFRFTQGLEAGTNRAAWGPDGAIYLGGIGSTGNWGQEGKERFGLERMKCTGEPTFEMLAVRALSNGMEIEFTEPLPEGAGWNPGHYHVEQFRYEPTANYGGPKIDQERLIVNSASVSDDRRRVFLDIDGMKPEHVIYLRLLGRWVSAADRLIWTTEAWYTLNQIPLDRRGRIVRDPPLPPLNALTEEERAEGWRLLFDGHSIDQWRGYHSRELPSGWEIEDGCMVRAAPAGDIVSRDTYEDFELSLEWKVEQGGNSGIFFHVGDGGPAVWTSGPEVQVLDNDGHPDGENPLTSAGAIYGLYQPDYDASYPPGVFNAVYLRIVDGHVTYKLNDQLQAQFTIGSADWNKRVAKSKFAGMSLFGRIQRGRIALQDHGDVVWFRNIKIHPLD